MFACERIDFCQVFFIKVDLTLFCLILLGSFPTVCLSVRRCIHRGGDVMQMSIVRNERKKMLSKICKCRANNFLASNSIWLSVRLTDNGGYWPFWLHSINYRIYIASNSQRSFIGACIWTFLLYKFQVDWSRPTDKISRSERTMYCLAII